MRYDKEMVNLYTLVHFIRLMGRFPFREDSLQNFQLKKLKRLLIHAYENFSFYRERMDDCRLNPYKIGEIGELELLPPLTKEEYRGFTARQLELNPEKYRNFYVDRTSGSTGIPLDIIRTWPERGYMIAKWLRELYLNGFRSSYHSFRTTTPSRLRKGREIFLQRYGLFRRTLIPFSLPEAELIKEYNLANPDFFYASQAEAVLMAQYALEHGMEVKKPKIYSVGGAMIDRNARVVLDRVFGKENFFETYACEEAGVLAFQIKNTNGLHFCHDTNILELVDDDGNPSGEEGHCLITDLHIYSFPLIRYQLGDVLKTFRDEEGTRRIESILGRLDDWIIWRDGSICRMGYFYEIMGGYAETISRFRIIQEDFEHLRILVALLPSRDKEGLDPETIRGEIVNKLKQNVREDVIYDVEFVDRIPPDTTGKIRMVVSKVKQGA